MRHIAARRSSALPLLSMTRVRAPVDDLYWRMRCQTSADHFEIPPASPHHCNTSQCSTRIPSPAFLLLSAAIQARGLPWPEKRPCRNHEVALGDNELILVFESVWKGTHQVKEAVAAGRDMSAVLDVVLRPEALGRGEV